MHWYHHKYRYACLHVHHNHNHYHNHHHHNQHEKPQGSKQAFNLVGNLSGLMNCLQPLQMSSTVFLYCVSVLYFCVVFLYCISALYFCVLFLYCISVLYFCIVFRYCISGLMNYLQPLQVPSYCVSLLYC